MLHTCPGVLAELEETLREYCSGTELVLALPPPEGSQYTSLIFT